MLHNLFFRVFCSCFFSRSLLILRFRSWTSLLKKWLERFFAFVLFSWKSLSLVFSSSLFFLSSHQIKLRCLFVTQKKKFKMNKIFFEKEFECCRIITLWCFFVVVVNRFFEIERLKTFEFFWWLFNRRCKLKNDVYSNLMWILHALRKDEDFLRFFFRKHQLLTMRKK